MRDSQDITLATRITPDQEWHYRRIRQHPGRLAGIHREDGVVLRRKQCEKQRATTRVLGSTGRVLQCLWQSYIRRLSEYCNYGDSLNEMLRDRLVWCVGLNDERIQRRLLAEADLSFNDVALAMEAAERINSKELQGTAADNVLRCTRSRKGEGLAETRSHATGAWENTIPHHADLKSSGGSRISERVYI